MEKVFEFQEEMTGYITGKIKGGFIANVEGLPCFMPSLDKCTLKGRSFNEYTCQSYCN